MSNNLFPKNNYYPNVRNVNPYASGYSYNGTNPYLSSSLLNEMRYRQFQSTPRYYHIAPTPVPIYPSFTPAVYTPNESISLEIILIAILILVSLDLVLIRPLKAKAN